MNVNKMEIKHSFK